MSCSKTPFTAGTPKNTQISQEDPYVFTETVPTTPPILFNNSQKSRNRFVIKQINTSIGGGGGGGGGGNITQVVNQTATKESTPTFTKVKSYGVKTQTSASVAVKGLTSIATTTTNTTAVLGVLNTNNIKYGPQSPKQQTESNQPKHTQHVLLAHNENATTPPPTMGTATAVFNSNINQRNNQQQKQQQQQQQLLQQKLQQQHQQSSTPPPLLLSHTPSLWQTPLLLDNPTIMTTSSSPPSSTTTSSSASPTVVASTTTNTLKDNGIVGKKAAPLKLSFQPPTPTLAATAMITPIATAPTTVTGSIAPLHLIMPSAAPLPPSNFHHTTLAQHLQKVQCLKKPKKPASIQENLQITTQLPTPPTLTAITLASPTQIKSAPPLTQLPALNATQHSATDLNEIPVNVIFRSPAKNKNIACRLLKDTNKCSDLKNNRQVEPSSNAPGIITESNSKLNTTNAPIAKKSSKSPQKRNYTATLGDQQQQNQPKTLIASQSKSRKLQKPASNNIPNITTSPTTQNTTNGPVVKSPGKRKTNTNSKSPKRNRKLGNTNGNSMAVQKFNSSDLIAQDVMCSTKGVAVIRMQQNEVEADISVLADEVVLPYCLQQYWYNKNDQTRSIKASGSGSGSSKREERIAEYKSVLQRQAMQLLATRSLQQLPWQIARKRLLCVDALLRKYGNHQKNAISNTDANSCEIAACNNPTLEMTTFCQQHITKTIKQGIFVQCSAKNLNDNQKPCDVPVLNIQKQYTPALCYLHAPNRLDVVNVAMNINNSILPLQPKKKKSVNTNTPTKSPTSNGRKRNTSTSTAAPTLIMPTDTNADKTELVTLLQNNKMGMQRKNSTTSLESIASNSHSSFTNSFLPTAATATSISTNVHQQLCDNVFSTKMLSPPALAPLSYSNSNNINHNNSLDNTFTTTNERQNYLFGSGTMDPAAEQEINKLVAQFAMAAAATGTGTVSSFCNSNNSINSNNFNYMNTNSNSNLTSSGVGSSSSLPSTDELLTQDMLSICENSSAYASSSEDTGLGELSESELIGASVNVNAAGVGIGGVGGGGFTTLDDVNPDEIPLGDTRLLEENDLVNVFGTLPVNLNELFNAVVQQDERDEVERALEIADKHLKTLQQTIGSDSDFLADFLDVNDAMLDDTDDICSKMEIVSSAMPPNENIDAATLYLDNADNVLNGNHLAVSNVTLPGVAGNTNHNNNPGVMDVRGLLQT